MTGATTGHDRPIEHAGAAVRAAIELLAGARPERVIGKTNPRDLVTEWDVRTEELIRGILEARAPGVPILGEEGGHTGEPGRPPAGWSIRSTARSTSSTGSRSGRS